MTEIARVYVGKQIHCPALGGCPYGNLHPSEFKSWKPIIDRKHQQFWTNNPYVVDLYQGSEVILCTQDQRIPLEQHPTFQKWKGEMSTGEIWSFIAAHGLQSPVVV